jgi:hypothetical protein
MFRLLFHCISMTTKIVCNSVAEPLIMLMRLRLRVKLLMRLRRLRLLSYYTVYRYQANFLKQAKVNKRVRCGGMWGCGGSVGMWWLSGDVVAQSAKRQSYTRLQRSSSGFDPGIPHSLLRGGRNNDCVLKTNLRM